MPSLEALCDICSYFEITPTEFFDPDIDNPNLFHEIMDIIKKCLKEMPSCYYSY